VGVVDFLLATGLRYVSFFENYYHREIHRYNYFVSEPPFQFLGYDGTRKIMFLSSRELTLNSQIPAPMRRDSCVF
jgi:hypothetical protein